MRTALIKTRVSHWLKDFPWHWLLAILVALAGHLFLRPSWGTLRGHDLLDAFVASDGAAVARYLQSGGVTHVTRVMLGLVIQLMAIGLLARARIAWAMSVLLLLAMAAFLVKVDTGPASLIIFTILVAGMLVAKWHHFDRASLAAGSLFAILALSCLLVYSVFGSLYLGNEFSPAIVDPVTAFYFSLVSMSTVGYGDIVPKGEAARMFTLSVVMLGITLFATSLSVVVGPLVGGNIRRLLYGRISHVMRKDHTVLAGTGPLALSLYHALIQRGHEVTVIQAPGDPGVFPAQADILQGDASDTELLRRAGAHEARYVLALRAEDAENAFIILAAREVIGPDTRLVALVNAPAHLDKVRHVNPDIVISLQALGAEILARTLSGEPIDDALIKRLLFGEKTPA
ncbi:voltage-gated potassium channel protein [Castellaniella sp.]|uniref:voltage-gated potassium channel protein n=1 Tax=Castellaniella sp. TaxID=1955812 RepID=UPI00355D7DF7